MRGLTAVLVFAASLNGAEVLDRIAVVVGDQVITENAIRRQIRLVAFVRGDVPDYSPAVRRETAETLIRQLLVRRELELSRYTPPGMDEAEKQLEANLGARGPEFLKRLEQAGFTELDLKETFLDMVSFTRFVNFRFSPGVTLGEQEIRNYYEKEYVPGRLRQSSTDEVEPLPQVQALIVRILEARKANSALDQWLTLSRQQAKIRYVEEAFQ
jgi:hypothetical protein